MKTLSNTLNIIDFFVVCILILTNFGMARASYTCFALCHRRGRRLTSLTYKNTYYTHFGAVSKTDMCVVLCSVATGIEFAWRLRTSM